MQELSTASPLGDQIPPFSPLQALHENFLLWCRNWQQLEGDCRARPDQVVTLLLSTGAPYPAAELARLSAVQLSLQHEVQRALMLLRTML